MIKTEAVASLLLDEENPRFARQAVSQDDALTIMLEMIWPKIHNLAKDIVQEGSVNPTELPIGIKQDGRIVVIEGNRRLAALKLLNNPYLAADASTRLNQDIVGKFRALQKQGTGPALVDVWVAESRHAARHWIELRHTGENNGVGVVEWEAWQANAYRRRRGSQADRANIFCTAVEKEYPGNAELLAMVETVRRTKLTTLGRLVGDPGVRVDFGFRFEDDDVFFEYPRDAMLPGITRIFQDLVGKVSVTDLKTRKHRSTYVGDRSSVLPPRQYKLETSRRAGEDSAGQGTVGAPARPPVDSQRRKSRKEPGPERVIFEGLRLPNTSPRIRQLLAEAQKINIDDAPQATAVLIRIVVELVVTDAILRGSIQAKEKDSLRRKLRVALLTLDPQCADSRGRDKKLEMAWVRSQDNDGMAVESMHAFIHNPHGYATPNEVRALSFTFRHMLEQLDDLIASTAS